MRFPNALNIEVEKATGVSKRTVSSARTELRREGRLQRTPSDRLLSPTVLSAEPILVPDEPVAPLTPESQSPEKGEEIAAKKLAELLATAGAGPDADLDVEEMKKRLSRIAMNPLIHPQIQIKAMEVKRKIDFDSQDTHELGPGPPLTKADALDRLGLMFQACGPELVLEAFHMVFKAKEVRDEGKLPADASETPPLAPGPSPEPTPPPDLRVDEGSGEDGMGRPLPSDEHPDQDRRELGDAGPVRPT